MDEWLCAAAKHDNCKALYVCARVYSDIPREQLSERERRIYDLLNGVTNMHYTDNEVIDVELVGRSIYVMHDTNTHDVATIVSRHHDADRNIYAVARVCDANIARAIDETGDLRSFSLREDTRYSLDTMKKEIHRSKLVLDVAILPPHTQERPNCHALRVLSTFDDDADIGVARALRCMPTSDYYRDMSSDATNINELRERFVKLIDEAGKLQNTSDEQQKELERYKSELGKLKEHDQQRLLKKQQDITGMVLEIANGDESVAKPVVDAVNILVSNTSPGQTSSEGNSEAAAPPSSSDVMRATHSILAYARQNMRGVRSREEAFGHDENLLKELHGKAAKVSVPAPNVQTTLAKRAADLKAAAHDSIRQLEAVSSKLV